MRARITSARSLYTRIAPQMRNPAHSTSGLVPESPGMLLTETSHQSTIPRDCPLASDLDVQIVSDFIRAGDGKVVVLSGAGLSTGAKPSFFFVGVFVRVNLRICF